MSSELDQAKVIAERIARRVADPQAARIPNQVREATDVNSELAAVRSGLTELQNRLGRIEESLRSAKVPFSVYPATERAPAVLRTHSPWLAGVNDTIAHPSQERFGVEEATVAELVDYFQNEKTCSIEPGGRPCDHCSMCSSRGF
jgi:hypothetical protein